MSDVGSVWWGHGLLIAGCAVGALPLCRLKPWSDRTCAWATRAALLALALLIGSMGQFRLHASDVAHSDAAEILHQSFLLTGLLLGFGMAKPRWMRFSVLVIAGACLLSLPTALVAPLGLRVPVPSSDGPGALTGIPAAWILGYAFPVYAGLAAAGGLLALVESLRTRRQRPHHA